jgi:hypothetical protein
VRYAPALPAITLALLSLLWFPPSGVSEPESAAPPLRQPGPPRDDAPHAFHPDARKQLRLETDLIPWRGEEIIFLALPGDHDPALMSGWVRQLDQGWRLYADLTGAAPRLFKHIDGKPVIAAVPTSRVTCGAGCGYLGATGIELARFYEHDYPALQRNPEAIAHYVFYEMGRNYYTFRDRHSCFTTGFAVFMRYVCMDALNCGDEDARTRQIIEGVEARFAMSPLPFLDLFTNSGALGEKEARIKDEEGNWIQPSDQPVTYASAMLRLRRECGGDAWLKRFFAELTTCHEFGPTTKEHALAQCWNWLLCASVAAKRDLSPIFADEWRMPLDDATRKSLAAIDWNAADLSAATLRSGVAPGWK